ncbi:cupin domain-containing protein [Labilibaculum sp.]|uniref:cupin domain-containing protein n=1 Tax=Labilibaculum sp. TaxID=2060723 RepID=UPI00356ACF61
MNIFARLKNSCAFSANKAIFSSVKKGFSLLLFAFLFSVGTQAQEIPIVNLTTDFQEDSHKYSKLILENEISGVDVELIALTGEDAIIDRTEKGCKTVYLFYKGKGTVVAEDKNYDIVPETILLPNHLNEISVKTAAEDTLCYLKISSQLTAQDLLDLKEFPTENTQNVYYKKFTDCESYTEAIKSPNTVSRTILPNKYIPRVAMGTVQTKGPDRVAPHEHPMLEQLFLGLSDNHTMVYADEAKVNFPEYSLLHIPVGSSHSVSVEKEEVMYYVWMDFFMDKKGEEWLKTHKMSGDE